MSGLSAPGALDTPADSAESVRDAVYRALRSQLVEGQLPGLERLAEKRLAQALGVSRTPVREALFRLCSEGFVRKHPQGGFVPVIPDLRTIGELYDMRFALERWAITAPLRTGVPHDRAALLALDAEWRDLRTPVTDAEAGPSVAQLDEQFHLRLAALADNHELVATLQSVNERIRPVRAHDFLRAESIEDAITEHRQIVQALLDGDVEEADRRLAAHFQQTRARVERKAALVIAAMVTGPRG